MDHQFTEKVQGWLDTPAEKRDYDQGAVFLLQLSNNQIMYRNVSRCSKRYAEFIEYNIRKYMKFRLEDLTHSQVSDMQKQVDIIAQLRHLDTMPLVNHNKDISESGDKNTDDQNHNAVNENNNEFKAGKRLDHNSLPAEIQALYVENADIIHKMRELHMQLRNLSTANSTCPDSERYPFLKELISLDKKYHHNWQVYDSWAPEKSAENAQQQLIQDERQVQKNIYRQINLTKGRYKKMLKEAEQKNSDHDSLTNEINASPSDALKQHLGSLYSQLASPSEALTKELQELGVLPSTYSIK